MSPSNVRRAALLAAAAAAVVASATSASAFDFSNPSDKRAYCQVYARQALNDVQSSQTRRCGFTGIAWSNDFNEQFSWCMSQSDVGATTQENVTRSTAVEQCSGSASQFPPVVADTPVQTASNFPPVVANEAVEQPSSFPPVVASDPPQVADEPVVQSASFPPVVQSSGSKPSKSSSGSGRTAEVSFPPVVDESEVGGDSDVSDIATTDPFAERSERMRQVAERLIEFGREHEVEIREAAHKVKEKFKQKLSDLKEQHDNGGDQVTDKLKAKIKQKLSNFKEQPGKHSDTMAGKFKEKIKQKLSNLKERGGNGQDENSLRSKVKSALKDGLMRRLANR
jgi:hypothetical protein